MHLQCGAKTRSGRIVSAGSREAAAMVPPACVRRGSPWLMAAAATAAAVTSGTCWLLAANFPAPPARTPPAAAAGRSAPCNLRGAAAEGAAAAAAEEPDATPSRRRAALGTLMGAALGFLAAVGAGVRSASAFENEENRIALYNSKAKQLNDAVDWYVFELRPLIFPPAALVELSDCEVMGDQCPERAGLSVVSTLYQPVGQTRGGGGVVLSKLDRDVFSPMKLLATSSVFDPDTEDELTADCLSMEKSQALLGRAARKGDLAQVKAKYYEGQKLFNSYFQKVNNATGLPENTEFYLKPIPDDPQTLESDYYWVRRQQKWLVKKKVDTVSKGNKTARFYAKSMFGDDAVSWDPRGDRAAEFYK